MRTSNVQRFLSPQNCRVLGVKNNLTKQDIERFFSKVKIVANGCWEWSGGRDKDGYGKMRIGKRMFLSHRLSYKFHFGEVPEGKEIMHRCDNPPCCNPSHLCAGSHKENCQDRTAKGRDLLFSGSKNGKSKLTASQVLRIRELPFSPEVIAKMFSISVTQVKRLRNFQQWRHLGMQQGLFAENRAA